MRQHARRRNGRPEDARDSLSKLRQIGRRRVALVREVTLMVLMLALGTLNARLPFHHSAVLASAALAAAGACVMAQPTLPKRPTRFFSSSSRSR